MLNPQGIVANLQPSLTLPPPQIATTSSNFIGMFSLQNVKYHNLLSSCHKHRFLIRLHCSFFLHILKSLRLYLDSNFLLLVVVQQLLQEYFFLYPLPLALHIVLLDLNQFQISFFHVKKLIRDVFIFSGISRILIQKGYSVLFFDSF